jgi:hypothetical protein
LSRRPINLLALSVPLIALALLCEFPSVDLRNVVTQITAMVGSISEVNYWGVPSLSATPHSAATAVLASSFIVCMFGVIAFVFIPVGQLVGWLLENASDGIFGYTVNVLASLAGIVLFTLLCFKFEPTRRLVLSGRNRCRVLLLEAAETAMDRAGHILRMRCADRSSG